MEEGEGISQPPRQGKSSYVAAFYRLVCESENWATANIVQGKLIWKTVRMERRQV